MKINFIKEKLVKYNKAVLILPIFQKEKLYAQAKQIDGKLDNLISTIISDGYYEPTLGNVHVIYTNNKINIKKIVLVGLGEKKDFDIEKYYQAISSAISYINKTKISKCAVFIENKYQNNLQNIAEIAILSTYKFSNYKNKKNKNKLESIDFIVEDNISSLEIKTIIKKVLGITEGIFLARDLANHPSNYLNPVKMAEIVKKLFKNSIDIKIYGEQEIEKMGMGLMKSVSRGSKEDAKLIILDYKPKKFNTTLALVGKGLTFDSGGVSLKPSYDMDLMKMDMAGAAAVIGAFTVITKIKPNNIRIIGAIGATENMQSHMAQKPGDIWRSYSGKTVEVLNTDAEGRLVLADVLSYVQDKYHPEYLVDIATLTGACMIALGQEYAGAFGNNNKLLDIFSDISQKNYEKTWEMPINQQFHNEVKSEIADLKNMGNGRDADACIAAAFLEEFIDRKTKWAHLDIAGPAIITKSNKYYIPKGGSGFGVKTIIELIKKINKLKLDTKK